MKQQKQQNQKPKERSPNLLQTTAENTFIEKYYIEISRLAVALVVLIQVLFIGLLIYNSKTVADIENAQNDIRGLGIVLYNKQESEIKIKETINKISRLKQIMASREFMEEQVTATINKLPSEVTLETAGLKQTGMKLTVETASPLEISLLISSYLKDNFAREIVINSASLDRSSETFTTELEVKFQ